MSSDDVIKNPARTAPKPQKKYEPEYVRLGREPRVQEYNVPDTFAGLDDMVFDADGNQVSDLTNDSHLIDNNEMVNFDNAFDAEPMPEIQNNVSIPEVGEYLLMVFGDIVASGSLQSIEERVRAIMYGEDKQFADLAPEQDDIVVLKRIGIKVGIFLNE